MPASRFSKAKAIPAVTTKKSSPFSTNFAKGIFTYKPNDAMDYDEIYLAQNARFDRIGEYKTRRGISKLSEPIGKTAIMSNYTDDYTLKTLTSEFRLKFSLGSTYQLYSIEITAATTDDSPCIVQASILDDGNNVLGVTCAKLNSTDAKNIELIFKNGIPITQNSFYTLVLTTQEGSPTEFNLARTPSGDVMRRLNIATAGQVTNVFEANIEGVKTLLYTFKTASNTGLYRMAEDGTVTLIRQLPDGVGKVRFSQNTNQIRYVDGQEGPRLINPSNGWTDTSIPTLDLKTEVDLNIKTSNILSGTQDNIIYFDAETTTQAVWTYPYGFSYAPEAKFNTSATINEYVVGATTATTVAKSTIKAVSDTYPLANMAVGDWIVDDEGNYGEITAIASSNVTVVSILHNAEPVNNYDAFDRDFRQNFPAIKTGDPLTAMFDLGGIVYFLTRRNKYYMYSQTADVWTQQASSAQHGTFSQESVVCNLNYAYYANDDGIYVFDGSSESSLTQNTIQGTYDAIANKESITLELYRNRLYVFYSSKGNGINDSCLIYNINIRLWESFDTGLPISATTARRTASNRFICGSNSFGQLFLFEDPENEFADLGAPIDFDLETSYLHFGTPGQLHRIAKWRPEFATTKDNYTVKCGYVMDFSDDVKYAYSISLHDNTILNEHYVWDNPPTYGNPVTPTKLTTIPIVNGRFRRVQLRYQHHAAFEPVNFKSHTLCVQTERIR